MLDLQLLMGSWRQLQAVSRDPDAGEHREGGNQWVSTKEFGEEFHGSAVIEAAPAEAGAVDCSAGGLISPLLLPCLSRLGFVWLSARRHQAPRHSLSINQKRLSLLSSFAAANMSPRLIEPII